MKLTEEFSYMGVHSRNEMIKKFLEFEHNVLFIKGDYIYSNGLLHQIKSISFKYPYTVLTLDFYPKEQRY